MMANYYDLEPSQAFKKALVALDSVGFTVETSDEDNGKIVASSGASLASWGEEIDIDIIKAEAKTKVCVSSTSKAQLFAWGKNEKNEKRFLQEFEKIIG
jgi:hypothetical protein